MSEPKADIVRMSDLPTILGISTATINRLRKDGDFVKPIELGRQAIGFRRSEIDAWLNNRPQKSHFIETL